MDITKQFSLTDFLSYFFPGVFATVGIYFLLQLTPLKSTLTISSPDVATGVSFLVISYIIGIISAGFSDGLVKQVDKFTKYKSPQKYLPNDIFPDEIQKAFTDVFDTEKEAKFTWTNNHYRLCRSLVIVKLPALAPRIGRLDDMTQLRRNLVFPLLIWAIAGISWGVWYFNNGLINWGISVVILSLTFFFFVTRIIIQRMRHNRDVETRETLLGFLAGYKTGIFSETEKS
jgi:uncharacterized membrane protein YjfL (UPF0719 family)